MPSRPDSPDSPATVMPDAPRAKPRRPTSLLRAVGSYTTRQKQLLLSEMVQVNGFMPLLMKQRNRQRWSGEDKAELAAHLKRLSQLSPYLMLISMPGGFLMLPALAWWLDRRRSRGPSAR